MNIQNRLKNLEGKASIQGFCECFSNNFKALAGSVYDDVPYKPKDHPVPAGNFCSKCKKPVNIELQQSFEKNLAKAYSSKN